jgi:tetratricopeptide (TPR) repeat protein
MRFAIIVPGSLILLIAIAVIGASRGTPEPIDLYPTPENAEEFLRRGELYEEAGDYEKALADYAQAEQLNSDDSSVYLGQGASLSALNQPAAAVEKYLIVREMDLRNGRSTYIIDDLIAKEREKL